MSRRLCALSAMIERGKSGMFAAPKRQATYLKWLSFDRTPEPGTGGWSMGDQYMKINFQSVVAG